MRRRRSRRSSARGGPSVVPPVVVGWDGAIDVPLSRAGRARRRLGDRGHHRGRAQRPRTRPAVRAARRGPRLARRRGALRAARAGSRSRELGYHTLRWRVAGVHRRGAGDRSAASARGAGRATGPRRWGVFAPVYGLGQPGERAGRRPGHAAQAVRAGRARAAGATSRPCRSSRRSSTSRASSRRTRRPAGMFWNELYLDLAALAGELGIAPPAAPPIIAGARIDYRTQYHWRRHALDPLAERLLADARRRDRRVGSRDRRVRLRRVPRDRRGDARGRGASGRRAGATVRR